MRTWKQRRDIVTVKRLGVFLLVAIALLAQGVVVGVASAQTDGSAPEITVLPQALERISWGAVVAGAIIALILQLAFNLLAIGIGVSTINPQYDDDMPSPKAIGTGAIVSVMVSALISLFIGGFLAARFAGIPDNVDGLLHGVMVWGVVSLIVLLLMTTTIGKIISGTTTLLHQGLQLAGSTARVVGQGVASVAQGAAHVAGDAAQGAAHRIADAAQGAANTVSDAAQTAMQADHRGYANGTPDLQSVMQTIRAEAEKMMVQAGVSPEQVAQQVKGAGQEVGQAVKQAVQNPADAGRIFTETLDRVLQRGQDVASHADRQLVIDVMVQRGMSPEDAERTLKTWEDRIKQTRDQVKQGAQQLSADARGKAEQLQVDARRKADEMKREAERIAREAEQKAREAAQATTQAISKLALAAFAALVIGAIAGGVGGLIGAPEVLPTAEVEVDGQTSNPDTPNF
jgi:hypothetical protein